MILADAAIKSREDNDPIYLIDAIPYAKLLGILPHPEGDELLFHLPPKKGNVGNPTLPALHGGALGGFMEMAGVLHLLMNMRVAKLPKVVDFSIDYVRAGLMKDTYASCMLIREGRKLANVHVEAWQDDRSKPIARARANFLVD